MRGEKAHSPPQLPLWAPVSVSEPGPHSPCCSVTVTVTFGWGLGFLGVSIPILRKGEMEGRGRLEILTAL